nr:uncharacterized protein LOC125993625 isoform X3 [Syngnathus scovelli]
MDELLLLIPRNLDVSRSATLCFTELWLTKLVPNRAVQLPGRHLMAPRMAATVSRSLFLCLILCVFCVFCCPSRITFTREALLNIGQSSSGIFSPVLSDSDCLSEILAGAAVLYKLARRRRRGKRAGALVKLRQRGFRSALPSIHLANVRSLANKMDELLLLTSRNTDFSRSAALCFVETWLSERTPHHAMELAGFRLTRADRSAELSGKSKGGGLCFYINERWCTDVMVLKEFCSPLLETLFINCRPFYSPREFSSIVMAAVYIPPHARASEATQMLADQVTDMEKLLPNSLIIVLGDLNRANLAHELPRYRQHITCPTRGAQTLDHCYTTKTFCTYNNDKPWFTPNLRRLRKVKEEAYRSGDRDLFKQTRNTLNREVRKASRCYGESLERHLSANPDPSTVWKGLQSITSFKKRTPRPVESPRLADQLNRFYCRFDRSSHTTGPPAAQSTQSTYSPPPTTALSTPPSPWSPTLSLAEAAPALQIREEEVRRMFRRQKIRKAPGPDGVSPSCLKVCAEQLAPTFARIFNRSLELCEVPSCFKSSTIVPVAKKPAITGMNDYRPVALTSVVMKSFERLVLNHLKDVTGPLLDPHQFAYRANRSVDDAVNMGLHYILQHLDTPGKYARILFVDFSSAFNTIAPDILQQKLIQLAVPASTCQWITSFLTNRRQRVRLGSITSDTLTTNTGAPQGCVLSPLLFSLYTNDFSASDSSVKLLKYADDTTLIGLIQNGDETAYRQEVERLVHWCSQNHLDLNPLKTVEMTVDFRRGPSPLSPLTIRSNTILSTDTFKFLGTTISRDLKWTGHIDSVRKKAQQRLYFLRQLKKFNLPRELLKTFYTAIIQSVLCTSITVWFGSASKQDKHRLQRTIRTAEKIIGINLPSIQDLYLSRTRKRASNISTDPSHPGCSLFELLPSGRRYRALYTKTSRHRDSFFPQAVALMNSHHS